MPASSLSASMSASRCVEARLSLRRSPPVAASMPASRYVDARQPLRPCLPTAAPCPPATAPCPPATASLYASHCSLRARLVSARSCRSSLSFADVVYTGCVRQLYPPLVYAGFPDLLPACASYSDCPPTPSPLVSAHVIVRPCSLVGFALSQAMLSVGVEAGDALLAYGCGSRNTLLNRIIMSQMFARSKKIITFVCLSRTRYPRI